MAVMTLDIDLTSVYSVRMSDRQGIRKTANEHDAAEDFIAKTRAVIAATRFRPLPEGMTADKLRQVADYITDSDNIIIQILDLAGVSFTRGEKDVTNEWSELVAGRAMQEDLRKWADEIEDEQ